MVKGAIRSAEALFAVSLLVVSMLFFISHDSPEQEQHVLKEAVWRTLEYLESRGILHYACNSTSSIEGWLEPHIPVEFDTAICQGSSCSRYAVPPGSDVYSITYPRPDCGFGEYEIRVFMWLGDEK